MMTINEMKDRKKALGYTNEIIAEKSGIPLSTVQKVFCGATKDPRRNTLEALEMVLKKPSRSYEDVRDGEVTVVNEGAPEYKAESGPIKMPAKKLDCWTGIEPSEKWPRQGEYTIKDVKALPDDIRVELIDGYIYEMAAPSAPHQRTVGHLYSEFRKCIEEHGKPCEVFMAPSVVEWSDDDRTEVQPDVQIRCLSEDSGSDDPKVVVVLVAEILSPSTAINDCTIKLRKYMTAGIKEYWIVDPGKERVLVYMFEDSPLPETYSFDDTVPVGVSGGSCSIDFRSIKERLDGASRLFGDSW